MQKEAARHLCAALVSTVAAAAVFYAPIMAIYGLSYGVEVLGDRLDDAGVFYAFTYAVPACFALAVSLVTRLLTLRLLNNHLFAISFWLPSVALIGLTALVGRYYADEALVYALFAGAGCLLTMPLARMSHAVSKAPIQDAGRVSG